MQLKICAAAPWLGALWWASLTTVGAVVVPMLFVHLPTPAMAGGMAAKLFTAQTWLGTVCALLLLMISQANQPSKQRGRVQEALVFIVPGMILALLLEFAIAPRIVSQENLRLWHSIGTALFVAQWLCAGATFWKLTLTRSAPMT